MSTPIETQLAEAVAEATRLREHNTVLLAEKKALSKAHATLQEQHGVATTELTRLQLDLPVEAMVASLAADPKLFMALFAEHHTFALDDEGRPSVRTSDGQPVLVKDKAGKDVPLPFEAGAIKDYLSPAKAATPDAQRWARVLIGSHSSGSGAPGGKGPNSVATQPAAEPVEPRQRVQFGLR